MPAPVFFGFETACCTGVELVIREARGVDPSQRVIRVGSETISYDWLVLASGAEMRFDLANAENFFTLDAAERLYSVLREFRGGTVAVVVTALPYKCPGAPAEGAMLIRDFLRQRGVTASVDLYTPERAAADARGGAAARRGRTRHARGARRRLPPRSRGSWRRGRRPCVRRS